MYRTDRPSINVEYREDPFPVTPPIYAPPKGGGLNRINYTAGLNHVPRPLLILWWSTPKGRVIFGTEPDHYFG